MLGAGAVVALQGWTVVIVLRAGAVGIGVRVIGSAAAQGRTVRVALVVLNLVLILEGCEARLHLVELRGIHYVLLTRRKHSGHLLLGMRNPVRGHGVRGKSLGQSTGLLLLLRLDLLEERDERLRVVT